MTDAFADLTETQVESGESAPSSTTDSTEGDSETPSESITTFSTDVGTFADSVRTNIPDENEIRDTERYSDPDSEQEADDVDTRRLFRKPTLNELRYFSRENPYGAAVVTKPIKDAFKHGFDVDGDNTAGEDSDGKVSAFLHEFSEYVKLARIHARRDGLCVIQHLIADDATSVAQPIGDDADWEGFTLRTIDVLSDDISESDAADHLDDYEAGQLHVTEGHENGGVVMVDDIDHPDDGEVVGYGVEPRSESDQVQDTFFLHAERCHHIVNDEHVVGDLGNEITGKQVGESILTPIVQPLRATDMGFWALKNILYRYSAPLHAVEPPESWGKEDFENFDEALGNISMASDATLPPGASLEVAEGVSEFDPEPFYETLVQSICAGTVFTKSVLQGVQSGTVSGSETDMKGYFNGVTLIREQVLEPDMRAGLRKVSRYDQSTVPRVADVDGIEIDWGPLFKPSDVELVEGAVSLITAATNGVKNWVLTPDEARSLVSEEWAEFEIDVELDELTEDQWDQFDRINIREMGQLSPEDEPDMGGTRQNPRLQNGGGQPAGENRESSQPTRDNVDSLSDEEISKIADEVAEKLK